MIQVKRAVAAMTAALLTAVALSTSIGIGAPIAAAAECPSSPVTITKLVRVFDLGQGLTCFGGRRLVFRAFVPPPCDGCGGVSAAVLAPGWLAGLSDGEIVLSAGRKGAQMVAYIPPALGRCPADDFSACPLRWYVGRWATFSGHFDGPVARTCRYVDHPPGPGFTKADAVTECRNKLIVLSVGPVLGPPATDGMPSKEDGPDFSPPGLLVVVSVFVGALVVLTRGRQVLQRTSGAR